MAIALLDGIDGCSTKGNKELPEEVISERLGFFVDAIENDADLELLGTGDDEELGELFVCRDRRFDRDAYGAFPKVPVKEVIEKCRKEIHAENLCRYLKGECRNGTNVMDGMTRIVGFYVHVRNFNKSKLGELVDRQQGHYGVKAFTRKSKERQDAINYVNNLPR